MPYCVECGKKNDDDARYCNKCGNLIIKRSAFEKDLEKFAEEFGRHAERFGKIVEKKAKQFAKSIEEMSETKTINCPGCGIELDADANYCWKCGKKIK